MPRDAPPRPTGQHRRSPRAAPAGQQLAHDLANALAAVRLRLDLVTRDPGCMAAQAANLEAMARILDDARGLAGQLEDALTPRRPMRARS